MYHAKIFSQANAENKSFDQMSAKYATRVPENLRKQTAEVFQQIKSFKFVGKEKITADHFILDSTSAEIFYYKMTLANRAVYYHFRFDKDGKIGWIVYEE